MPSRELPVLGYGAANVGNLFRALTDDEAWEILDAAWESGIRYFDTAPHYGLGLSERRLGAFLQTKPAPASQSGAHRRTRHRARLPRA